MESCQYIVLRAVFWKRARPGVDQQLRGLISNMVRITITPEWVGLLDFQTRFSECIVVVNDSRKVESPSMKFVCAKSERH